MRINNTYGLYTALQQKVVEDTVAMRKAFNNEKERQVCGDPAIADKHMRDSIVLVADTRSVLSTQTMLEEVWNHYKATMIEPSGQPIADDNMTFSETVSYVLSRAVEMNDKATFDKVWQWSYGNLCRNNIKDVFYANSARRDWAPPYKKDTLFAWRYITLDSHINDLSNLGLNKAGVPSWDWSLPEKDQPWVDGLDAAPDADILIAYSLLEAGKKWGNGQGIFDYTAMAKQMLPDIWDKCVLSKKIGGDQMAITFDNMWTDNTNAQYIRQPNGGLAITYGNDQSWGGIAGIHSLGLETLHTYNALEITASANKPTTIKLIFQAEDGREFGVDVKLTNSQSTTKIPIKYIVERLNYAFKGKSIAEVGKIVFKNFAVQGEPNTMIQIKAIALQGGSENIGSDRLLVSSNDKKSPVLNLSYVMPFALQSFAALDGAHPWAQLNQDFYTTVQTVTSSTMKYIDAKHPEQVYGGKLIPDWNTVSSDGRIASAYKTWDSFATSEVQDTNLASWDSFRAYLWIAMDYQKTKSAHSKQQLDTIAAFFMSELQRQGWIDNAYNTDGSVVANNRRGAQSKETPFGMSIALGVFAGLGDKVHAQQVLDLLMPYYHAEGYVGNKSDDYFTNNIFAFALAMAKDMGLTSTFGATPQSKPQVQPQAEDDEVLTIF